MEYMNFWVSHLKLSSLMLLVVISYQIPNNLCGYEDNYYEDKCSISFFPNVIKDNFLVISQE